jgi:hypothetical protein
MINMMLRNNIGGADVFQFFFSSNPNLGMLNIEAPKAAAKKSTEYFGILIESLKVGTINRTISARVLRTMNLARLCNAGTLPSSAQISQLGTSNDKSAHQKIL